MIPGDKQNGFLPDLEKSCKRREIFESDDVASQDQDIALNIWGQAPFMRELEMQIAIADDLHIGASIRTTQRIVNPPNFIQLLYSGKES